MKSPVKFRYAKGAGFATNDLHFSNFKVYPMSIEASHGQPGLNPAETSGSPGAPGHLASGLIALVAASFAMGISPTFVRVADVGPFASAFWRVFLALPVLWFWMKRSEAADPAERSDRFPLGTVFAGLAFTGDLFFWHLAIMNTSVANATFFATMAPLWVVIFGWLLLRQRVSRATIYGLGFCLVGGAALVAQSLAFNPAHALGDLFGVATGVFFGLYFLSVGAARVKSGAARVTFELSLITAMLLFLVAFVAEPRILPHSINGWAAVIALGVVSHAGGQGLLSVALGRLPTAFSSLVIFLEAIAAALFAWILLHEPVTLVQAAGGLVILFGIWIARPKAAA